MLKNIALVCLLLFIPIGCTEHRDSQPMSYISAGQRKSADIDAYTIDKLKTILALTKAHPSLSRGAKIGLISRQFLGAPYVAHRLIGSATTPERLVADFGALDCFTYLDYVEALRRATSEEGFIKNLSHTRYIGGQVAFLKRKHFFSDWAYRAPALARDITAKISPHALSVAKVLNRKSSSGSYLYGLPDVKRTVTYIPRKYVNHALLRHLRTGDYIGIYAKESGLDVTHVGIFIRTKDGPMFRNASSRKANMKVVDSHFLAYVAHTPGIVVYRPR
ncbi:DUF1460 domain-containing protein [Phyllobacterium leguminum]|uniref:Uncharacterized protein DUF1460 n=1 Tax=Phyllobacterium leguminum TaxID=314237 RepID=A0A318T9Q4_9HYPH|nr:DUF1460 domain-containing protein [Phyllobacterium leguminum]PYE90377.1 uncharacterized protein DUF1460 [Phyllobacterium leguminum]